MWRRTSSGWRSRPEPSFRTARKGILTEGLPDAGGYPRILAAIGRERARLSQMTNEAGHRVEHPLEVLVRRAVPWGHRGEAVRGTRSATRTWPSGLRVLYTEVGFVAAGQGRAVQRRTRTRWQQHVGWVFEEAARAHAARLVQRGELPEDLVVGRWWATSGEPCEVDVLGLREGRTHLLGEVRWQDSPLGARDLADLMAKQARVPRPTEPLMLALWGRAGAHPALRREGVLGFDVHDVLR